MTTATPDGILVEFADGGLYRGRTANGSTETFPTLNRVFAALLSAAANSGIPQREWQRALTWVESNPPTSRAIPLFTPHTRGQYHNWGGTGRLNAKKSAFQSDSYPAYYGTVFHGELGWGWNDVPEEVAHTLGKIAAEVPYLGTRKSPCVMRFGEIAPTHIATYSDTDDAVLLDEVPVPGRLRELRTAYDAVSAGDTDRKGNPKASTVRSILNNTNSVKDATDARELLRHSVCAQMVEFAPAERIDPDYDAPWTRGVWLPLKDVPDSTEHVAIATEVHQSVIRNAAAVEGVVPPVLYGWKQSSRYAKKSPPGNRPSNVVNNVAYMVIGSHGNVEHAYGNSPGVLIAIPRGVSDTDADIIVDAALRVGGKKFGSWSAEVDPSRWWSPLELGHRRVWRTQPLAVSDVSFGEDAEKSDTDGTVRTVNSRFDAARALSYALGERKLTDNAVNAVARHRRADPMNAPLYVHHHNSRGVLPMFEAEYDLDGVLPSRAAVAVGQSRHFGVGVLIPTDIPLKGTH